jgi:hypothetical protein
MDDNRFLASLNDRLEAFELENYRDLEERHPTIHVLGLPRSGTTLALQLLVAHTDVAYTDHVAAAFWRAPATGLALSESLRRHLARPASFSSSFGRTDGLTEPHEFSYLWSRLLGLPFGLDSLLEPADGSDGVDWAFFRRVVTNMCDAVERPLVLKSFWAIWHLERICAELSRTVVVRIRRDELAVARSLVTMREELYGSRDAWASIKPRQYTWLSARAWPEQIAGQIRYTGAALEAGLAHVAPAGLVDVAYEDMCADPAGFVTTVVAAVEAQGGSVSVLSEAEPTFQAVRRRPEDATTQELARALDAFDASRAPGGER